MNQVVLIGRLAQDPQTNTTQSGKTVARFNLAVSRQAKNQQTGKPEADFITCVAWDKTAELVGQYCHKGKQIALQGRLQARKYEDRNGQNRTVVEVVCDRVEFLADGSNQNQGQYQQPYQGQYQQPYQGQYQAQPPQQWQPPAQPQRWQAPQQQPSLFNGGQPAAFNAPPDYDDEDVPF